MSCVEYLRRQLRHCNGNGRKPEHSPKPYTPTFGTRDAGFLIFFLFLTVGKKWGVFYSATAIWTYSLKKTMAMQTLFFKHFSDLFWMKKKSPHWLASLFWHWSLLRLGCSLKSLLPIIRLRWITDGNLEILIRLSCFSIQREASFAGQQHLVYLEKLSVLAYSHC